MTKNSTKLLREFWNNGIKADKSPEKRPGLNSWYKNHEKDDASIFFFLPVQPTCTV